MSARGVAALGMLGLVPLLGLGGFWVAMDRRVERGEWQITTGEVAVPPPIAGPVFSLRRQPQTLSIEVNDRKLTGALGDVTNNIAGESCFAAALDGRIVIADNADAPALPASNLKLITAAVALEVLGPDFTFVTRANGALVGDTIEGDLFFVGGGDPLLRSAGYVSKPRYPTYDDAVTSLEDLADRIAAAARRITGRIVADESHFDSERYAPGWNEEVRGSEAGPLSALLINDSRRLDDIRVPVDDPELYAARELTRLLRERGVEVAGEPVSGTQPGPIAEVASIASPPLSEVVKQMLTNSDNNTAEAVLKQLGVAPGVQGSRAAGIAKVTATLTGWGVPIAGVVINDGSGLDRGNRLTCRALVSVLQHAGTTGPLFAALPTPGGVGTLAESENSVAFEGLGVEGRVHAKTGTLRGAKALSGYFDLLDGRSVAFAMIVNGEGDVQVLGRLMWRQMSGSLASLTAGPSPDQLALPGA